MCLKKIIISQKFNSLKEKSKKIIGDKSIYKSKKDTDIAD